MITRAGGCMLVVHRVRMLDVTQASLLCRVCEATLLAGVVGDFEFHCNYVLLGGFDPVL